MPEEAVVNLKLTTVADAKSGAQHLGEVIVCEIAVLLVDSARTDTDQSII